MEQVLLTNLHNQTFSASSAMQFSGAKKGSVRFSRCCINKRNFLLNVQAEVLPPQNHTILLVQPRSDGAADERQVSGGEGSRWRVGSCSRTDKRGGAYGGQKVSEWGGRGRNGKGAPSGFAVFPPARCGPSKDVLNLLATFVLRPRQGGWKWGEGWRGGHKSAPFRLKTGFKSHFKDIS